MKHRDRKRLINSLKQILEAQQLAVENVSDDLIKAEIEKIRRITDEK